MSASPVIGHCMAYLSFFGRLGWSPDARTAVGFGVGPWNGPMGDSQECLAALRGRAFFIFQFAPGAKGLGFVGGFLLQRKAARIGDWPRGEFRLLRQATRGLCPRPPRFFEKNRVKLFSPGSVRTSPINPTASISVSGSAYRRSRRANLC